MASNRPHILVFIDWFTPGFKAGGPIRSLQNLTDALPARFSVITSAYDHHSEHPYEGIPIGEWKQLNENVRVLYLDREGPNAGLIRRVLSEDDYDKIYLNSLFSLKYALLPLIWIRRTIGSEKIILAPRGMLKGGALSVKAGKKKWFLRIAKAFSLFKGITWHATNEAEAEEIRSHFGDVRIAVAANLPRAARKRNERPEKETGKLKLVTIARISKEKGILEGVQFLTGLKGRVTWDIYGTHQDADYLAECRSLAKEINGEVDFKGEISPDRIPDAFSGAHFFYLPTLGENYGHAIAEALLDGLPVIISDRTPWRGLEEERAGWALPLEEEAFKNILSKCLEMDENTYEAWCRGAAEKGERIGEDVVALQQNLRLFGMA